MIDWYVKLSPNYPTWTLPKWSWRVYSNCTKRWSADVNVHRAECELSQVDPTDFCLLPPALESNLTWRQRAWKRHTDRLRSSRDDNLYIIQVVIAGGLQSVCDFLLLPCAFESNLTQDTWERYTSCHSRWIAVRPWFPSSAPICIWIKPNFNTRRLRKMCTGCHNSQYKLS